MSGQHRSERHKHQPPAARVAGGVRVRGGCMGVVACMSVDRAFIESRSIPDPSSGCWLWQHGRDSHGYGNAWHGGKHHGAHRVSWELANGPIPDGLCVCHKCDTPACVNPDHLFLGTHKDNAQDRDRKGRASAGDGHPGAKLTWAKVAAIRADNRTQRIISEDYGVARSLISRIRTGKSWGGSS